MDTLMHQDRIFIGGEWRVPQTDSTLRVESPVTQQEVGRTPHGSAADIDAAVKAARRAFDHGPWSRLSYQERADWLDKLADELESRAESISSIITTEIGQPIKVSRAWAGIRPLAHLRYYATIGRQMEQEENRPNVSREGTSIVRKEPIGVAGLIVPWNHPFASMTLKLAPALLAGVTVVIKPAPESPLDIYELASAAEAIGLPPGVINIVPGGRETGESLVGHSLVDKIAFTGSSATGRRIASVAGGRLAATTLELGGKSAAIILDSADLDAAIGALRVGSFENTGQTCALMSRVLAPEHLYPEVVDRLQALTHDLRVGDPLDEQTELGPLVSRRIYDRVSGMVENARRAGATIRAADEGIPERGYYYPPSVITDADPNSEIAQEEIFGPVVTVFPYSGQDEAVSLANNSRYGLAGAVFGEEQEALEVARRIRTGSIGINGYRPDLNHPYGGYKDSGLGREFAPEAVGNFQETKTIWR